MSRLAKGAIVVAAIAAIGLAVRWGVAPRAGSDEDVLRPLDGIAFEFPPIVTTDEQVVLRHDFRFRSELDRTLRVVEARTSCTCTEATAEPTTIGPGDELTVRTVTTLDGAGARHATIWVRFDDGRGVKARIVATLARPVELSVQPVNPRVDPAQETMTVRITWTGPVPDPGSPPVAAGLEAPSIAVTSEGQPVTAEVGAWAPVPLQPSPRGDDALLGPRRSLAADVVIRRTEALWPILIRVRAPGSDFLDFEVRDRLPNE